MARHPASTTISKPAISDLTGRKLRKLPATWHLFARIPKQALVRLAIQIFDDPLQPFQFESFLHVGEADQLQVLAELAGQPELILAFYGDDLRYRYSQTLPHSEAQWQQLDEIIDRGLAYWERLPSEQQDFDRAKALYMRIHP